MIHRIVPFLFAVALVAACTDGGRPAADRPGGPPAQAGGSVTVKGSDTLVLLAQRVAERFMAANPGKMVQVTGGGSGTGIAALINGTTDVATASRAMKAAEKAELERRRGAPAVETAVALDGIAVYVHASNPIESLTLDQIKRIFTGEVKNWKEVGGADAPILLYGRENNSGTYAFFKEEVLDDEDFAAETQSLPGTAAVVNAVANDPKAIGYGGIAWGKGIRTVPVRREAGDPAVEPTMENVTAGTYPISRKLFLYTAGALAGDVKAFIDFALSEEGQRIAADVGYYPLPKPAPAAPAADGAGDADAPRPRVGTTGASGAAE